MFTAKVLSITKDNVGLSANYVIEFDLNGNPYSQIPFTISDPNSLKTIIQNQINQYQKIIALDPATSLGNVDLTPPPPPVLTPAQIARNSFFADYQKVKQYETLINAGYVDPADKNYTELRTQNTTDFKKEYFGL